MKMMRRVSAFLLALLWALILSACGEQGVVDAPPPSAAAVSSGELVSEPPAQESEASLTPIQESEDPLPSSQETENAETPSDPGESESSQPETEQPSVAEDGWYDTKEEVALYIHLYGHLPDNFVTKREAQALGWSGGSVEPYAGEGTAIGGSRFGNYEGLLPEADGRTYTECDIGTVGGSSRGAKRLVFSNDGLIYYTEDHYQSFELLYGEP